MYTEKQAIPEETVSLTMRLAQALRGPLDLALPATVPIPKGCSIDQVSEFLPAGSENVPITPTEGALQTCQRVFEDWAHTRFVTLPPEFSPQMRQYWDPERQERVYRSLGTNSGRLERLEVRDRRQLPDPSGRMSLLCHATWSNCPVGALVRIVVRWDGKIDAFYVSPEVLPQQHVGPDPAS